MGNPRSMFKGVLKFSLVNVPIKMFTAVDERNGVSFNQIHRSCGGRIRYKNVCEKCLEDVQRADIAKGYPMGDSYVEVTDEEIDLASKERTSNIQILKFVDFDSIPPIYFSDAHYIAPDPKIGVETFALLVNALEVTDKVAIAKMVMRNKEHLVAIEPLRPLVNGGLIAYTLYYDEQIRDAGEIPGLKESSDVAITQETLALAVQLINSMSGQFDPKEIRDEYSAYLKKVIEAKASGMEIKAEPPKEKVKVLDLADALKASLAGATKHMEELKKVA